MKSNYKQLKNKDISRKLPSWIKTNILFDGIAVIFGFSSIGFALVFLIAFGSQIDFNVYKICSRNAGNINN